MSKKHTPPKGRKTLGDIIAENSPRINPKFKDCVIPSGIVEERIVISPIPGARFGGSWNIKKDPAMKKQKQIDFSFLNRVINAHDIDILAKQKKALVGKNGYGKYYIVPASVMINMSLSTVLHRIKLGLYIYDKELAYVPSKQK